MPAANQLDPRYHFMKFVRLMLLLSGALVLSGEMLLRVNGQQSDNAAIERYSREAEEALKEKDPDRAAAALEKLARLTPNVAEVHANLGMVYYAKSNYR